MASARRGRAARIATSWWAVIALDAVLTVAFALVAPVFGAAFVLANVIAGVASTGLLRRVFLVVALLGVLALAAYALTLVGFTTTTTVGPVTRL